MTLGGTIDDPDFAGVAAQVLAHLLEAGAVQESGNRDETHDAVSILFRLSSRFVPA
jgi:hypothetical protein